MNNFDGRYKEIWQEFTDKISKLSADIIETVRLEDGINLHVLLKSLQNIPYNQGPDLFGGLTISGEKRSNIGSITGLFFEIMTASIITGYMNKHLPDAVIELNSCSSEEVVRISRDPDIFVRYNERYVVFETKTSPKKRDLEYARGQYKKYSESPKIQYYVIGGHTSINKAFLKQLAEEEWVCFTSTSDQNKIELAYLPSLDELLEKSIRHLTGN